MVEAPLKVQCYASPDRTEVLSLPDDDSGATVHARVGGVRAVPLERAEEERLQRWRCLDEGLGSGRSLEKRLECNKQEERRCTLAITGT